MDEADFIVNAQYIGAKAPSTFTRSTDSILTKVASFLEGLPKSFFDVKQVSCFAHQNIRDEPIVGIAFQSGAFV
jgi:hypothetical protein